MSWRSVVIAHPAALSVSQLALQVSQAGQVARIPLEDMAALVIDHPQVSLNAAVLAACAEHNIALITVGATHLPNGVLLSYVPHSRALKVMEAQLGLSQPTRKRLWQRIVQYKVSNQASVLETAKRGEALLIAAARLRALARQVKSGDPDNIEAQAAQHYFRSLFSGAFTRAQGRFYNAALNYGYAVLRSALARSLVAYGFLPAFGLFHHNEQNAFNLADDLFEPFRPLVDRQVIDNYPEEPDRELLPSDKGKMVSVLHTDVRMTQHSAADGACTVLAALDATVSSFSSIVLKGQAIGSLALPVLDHEPSLVMPEMDEAERDSV